ncbi:hypothetical protein [Nonomuraea diastatica]|uniref:Uncharacterized protein n=1 Tax=Nonomuraea diastatica TaxID=1848329 RepID=A0A4R4WVE9_9ACTN|nr:hypothetical protein [Nonomuraea diastatica]TDD21625.1 hypothetical protein E1294_14460 [Nonomuraea diastatica]
MAIKQDRLLDFNPAAAVELPPAVRPKPVVWTEGRFAQWRLDHEAYRDRIRRLRDGKRVDPIAVYVGSPRPSRVMVWTAVRTSVFLGFTRRDRLFALYRLITLRGLRRGEAAGLQPGRGLRSRPGT